MSEAQIQDIYRRLGTLEQEVSNIKLITGTVGTSQVAIVRTLDMVTALADEVAAQREDIRQVKSDVAEILRILRDRNGGSRP
jgi:ABC-type transporter Mla subunit MlaD